MLVAVPRRSMRSHLCYHHGSSCSRCSCLGPLIRTLLSETLDAFARPCALFGHSMGALIAFELSRELRRYELPLPRTVIVSGRRPPTIPNTEPPLRDLPDAAFVDALVRRYEAIPEAIRNEPELMALFVPTLKADFAAFETHIHHDEPPLKCPVAMYGGGDDPQTEQMTGWAGLFSGPSRTRVFDGGHFYLAQQRRAVAEAVVQDVVALADLG
jgi:medium-chain acyl-[acyl-carrier-protein] hydrolase